MSTQSLAVKAPVEIQSWKSPGAIKMRIQAIQQLMSEVLKPGTKENDFSGDYGIIPGTGSKPSLWKAGSEQILAMFEIAVDPVVEDLSTDDCFRYRVTTRLTHAPTGNFLGAGIGEASSDETKYKWRRTYNQKEFDSTPVDRRRIKYSQYKDASGWVDKEEMQVRQEPADLANTILKMAKKRSQIDATLTVTGASSMFDQDLEDLTDEQKQAMQEQRGKVGKKKSKETPQVKCSVKCSECNAVGGHLPTCPKRQQGVPVTAAKTENVICGDCGKTNGHEPSCKYARSSPAQPEAASSSPDTASGLTKVAALILAIDRLKKKPNSKGVEEPYIRLTIVDAANHEDTFYVWHKTPQEYLTDAAIDKPILCEVSGPKKRGDGSTYLSLENILELAGVPFVNNMPAKQGELIPPATEEDF
jgi:hypothetical protein